MRPRNLVTDLRSHLARGETLDGAIASLRASGASIFECIVSVRSLRNCELGEAKRLVVDSDAWADVKEMNDKFHEELARLDDDDA